MPVWRAFPRFLPSSGAGTAKHMLHVANQISAKVNQLPLGPKGPCLFGAGCRGARAGIKSPESSWGREPSGGGKEFHVPKHAPLPRYTSRAERERAEAEEPLGCGLEPFQRWRSSFAARGARSNRSTGGTRDLGDSVTTHRYITCCP